MSEAPKLDLEQEHKRLQHEHSVLHSAMLELRLRIIENQKAIDAIMRQKHEQRKAGLM